MRTVEWHLSIGLAGADIRSEIEVEDDATDEEIDAEVRDAVMERVEWSWQ